MPSDRVQSGDIVGDVQEMTGALEAPPPEATQDTFAADMQDVVDDIRGLNAEFGIRPYRVFLVHAAWSGGRRGEGTLQVTSRREILPPPRVTDLDGLRARVGATGVVEEGDLRVDEISARIPQDDLMGRTPDLQDPVRKRTSQKNVEFFWEVVEARASIPRPAPRRFSPPVTLSMARSGFEWRAVLVKAAYDLARDGSTDRQAF